MNNYMRLRDERDYLQKAILSKEYELSKLPKGIFQAYDCGEEEKITKWYVVRYVKDSTGKLHRERKYLSKKHKDVAQQLVKRGLLEAELKDLNKELYAVNLYLKYHSDFEEGINYANKSRTFAELLNPYLKEMCKYTSDELEWLAHHKAGEAPYQEERVFRSKCGIMVRSKAEVIIISNLIDRHIAFKYEERLDIPGEKNPLYPDLTIMHPRTGEIFIWEHFGMMERMYYSNKTSSKLDKYRRAGFIPGHNMIMTFEDNEHVIDEVLIIKIIEHYFGV